MLKKLIRHEIKETYKVVLLILGMMAIVSILGVIYFLLPFWDKLLNNGVDEAFGSFLVGIILGLGGFFLYFMTFMASSYGILIFCGYRFYTTMYSKEGYLTHTLPVKPYQLLLSKVLVGGVEFSLIMLGMMLSLLVVGTAGIFGIGGRMQGYTVAELFGKIAIALEESGIGAPGSIGGILMFVLMVVLGPISSICTLYGAFTLGQTFRKYKAVLGVVIYFALSFGISLVTSFISGFVGAVAGVTSAITDTTEFSLFMVYGNAIVVNILISIILFFVSKHILENKLNLE